MNKKYDLLVIGSIGEKIVSELKKNNFVCNPLYVKISNKKQKNTILLPKINNLELLENNCPKIPKKFEKNIFCILSNIDYESYAALAILEKISSLQKIKINILYIKSENNSLSQKQKEYEENLRNKLQILSSLDFLNQIYLISIDQIKIKFGNNFSLENYYDQIFQMIAYVFQVFSMSLQNDYVFCSPQNFQFLQLPKNTKFCTFSILDINSNEEKLFYPLDLISDKRYIFLRTKGEQKNNNELMNEIDQIMSEKNGEEGIRKYLQVFYANQNNSIVVNYTSIIGF